MRRFALPLLVAGLPLLAQASAECPSLLDRRFERLQGEGAESLCALRGRVLLVVNTASQCGFTGQYEGLEKLHERYGERGLTVIGFPSNDFGAQEPGSNTEIAEFCRTEFGVRFPMFSKIQVRGVGADPFYRDLAMRTSSAPRWNFHKYLIDRRGDKVLAFPSEVAPEAPILVSAIERLLAEKP